MYCTTILLFFHFKQVWWKDVAFQLRKSTSHLNFLLCFLPIGLLVSWVTLLILCSALKIMFAYEGFSRQPTRKLLYWYVRIVRFIQYFYFHLWSNHSFLFLCLFLSIFICRLRHRPGWITLIRQKHKWDRRILYCINKR